MLLVDSVRVPARIGAGEGVGAGVTFVGVEVEVAAFGVLPAETAGLGTGVATGVGVAAAVWSAVAGFVIEMTDVTGAMRAAASSKHASARIAATVKPSSNL